MLQCSQGAQPTLQDARRRPNLGSDVFPRQPNTAVTHSVILDPRAHVSPRFDREAIHAQKEKSSGVENDIRFFGKCLLAMRGLLATS